MKLQVSSELSVLRDFMSSNLMSCALVTDRVGNDQPNNEVRSGAVGSESAQSVNFAELASCSTRKLLLVFLNEAEQFENLVLAELIH